MAGPCFTQDKVDGTLGDAIRAATDADVRCYLDATADIYQLLWRYGIHDYVWYFLLNNGIDSTGKVVCLDFGETFFDSTWVAERVDEARWEVKDNLIKALTPDQQDYYFKAMKSRLSGENFNHHWGAALDDLDREVIKRPILAEIVTPGMVVAALRRSSWAITLVRAGLEAVLNCRTSCTGQQSHVSTALSSWMICLRTSTRK